MFRVERELAGFTPNSDTLLTIGVFDGVHLGHKFLLSILKAEASDKKLTTGVVTFRQHPQELLTPQNRMTFLTSLDERVHLLKIEGIGMVVPLTFDRELANISARDFLALLQKYLRMKGLVLGPDFALGKDRKGDIGVVKQLGMEMGFSVTVVEPFKKGDERISSTAIRKALAVGDVKRVRNLAGQNFSFTGPIVAGAGRGRTLGFPTANLDVDPSQAIPQDGIYVTRAHFDGKTYPSVTSIGVRPTFDNGHRTIEVYVIDYNGNLYGKEFTVEFVEHLRNEIKFNSVDDLKHQIMQDVKQGKTILDASGDQ